VGRQITSPALSVVLRSTRVEREHAPFTLDVSFEVPPGFTILFGPSGAGKSTLLDCIAGLQRPDAGRIAVGNELLLDTELAVDSSPRKRRIAYVFQNLALFPHLSVEKNIAYGLAGLPEDEKAQRVKTAMDAFRIEKLAAQKPETLSGGERQRVALARSLATSPRVLLLDEPLTALDAALKQSITEDLRAWNSVQKIPILYVTHSRAEVDALGEHVIAMDHGKITATGTPLEVLESPRRSTTAQAAGFENILAGKVVELREADGVMRVRLARSACEIETPLGYAEVGDEVRVAIRAGDLLLATEPPRGLSARNVIPGIIASMEQRGTLFTAQVLTAVNSDPNSAPNAGASRAVTHENHGEVVFTVHLTPGAKRSLNLELNQPVWLVLKTHSCHLLHQ
jgi:molybdate transport system ATP-binding protein